MPIGPFSEEFRIQNSPSNLVCITVFFAPRKHPFTFSEAEVRHFKTLEPQNLKRGVLPRGIFKYQNSNTQISNHVSKEHAAIVSALEEQTEVEQAAKRQKKAPAPNQLTSWLRNGHTPYDADNPENKKFIRLVETMILACNLPFRIIEDPLFRACFLHLDPRLNFPSRSKFHRDVKVLTREFENKLIHELSACEAGIILYDLWMSRGALDLFGLVHRFVDDNWIVKTTTLGLVECPNTAGLALAERLRELMTKFSPVERPLATRCFAQLSDQGANLSTMRQVIAGEFRCDAFPVLEEPFAVECLTHALSGALGKALLDEKVTTGLSLINLVSLRKSLVKCVRYPKKSSKAKQAWKAACRQAQLPPKLINAPVQTRMATAVKFMRDCWEYREAFNICYSLTEDEDRRKRCPPPGAFDICEVIVSTLEPALEIFLRSQSKAEHWTRADAIKAVVDVLTTVQNYSSYVWVAPAELAFPQQLSVFQKRMGQVFYNHMFSFLDWVTEFSPKKSCNMYCLMLDPRFRSLTLFQNFQRKPSAETVAAYRSDLITLLESASRVLNPDLEGIEGDSDPDDAAEPYPERRSQDTHRQAAEREYTRYVTACKKDKLPEDADPFLWWRNNAHQFPLVASLAKPLLALGGGQSVVESMFSTLTQITSGRRSRLSPEVLDRAILLSKNRGHLKEIPSYPADIPAPDALLRYHYATIDLERKETGEELYTVALPGERE